MDKQKWMRFINLFWLTLSYWQMTKKFREKNPSNMFFNLAALAIRNELLMQLSHLAILCGEIEKGHDVGPDAKKTLAEIKALYKKGETEERSLLVFEDCGIKVFRDKILAHPLNHIKELLGKDQFQISLEWDTVEQTLDKIRTFCDQVEQHNQSKWDLGTYKAKVDAADHDFEAVMLAMAHAAKYELLMRKVGFEGKKVRWDWEKRDLVIEE